jgi:hypothetical protein
MWKKAIEHRILWGDFLPRWARVLRAILFPLDPLFWVMSRTRGYQWDQDVWIIEGVKYSGPSMRLLAEAQGEIFRAIRSGNVIHITRVTEIRRMQ